MQSLPLTRTLQRVQNDGTFAAPDEHWVEYGDGNSNHPLNDMDDAQRDLFDAALTQKGLIVED